MSTSNIITRNWRDLIRPRGIHDRAPRRSPSSTASSPASRSSAASASRVGNSLRRVLLSSLQGAAITAVRIDGALHEFTTHRRRRRGRDRHHPQPQGGRPQGRARAKTYTVRIEKEGPGPVYARDIQLVDGLAGPQPRPPHRDARQEGPARRWSSRSTSAAATCRPSATRRPTMPIGTIPIDALFSPIRKVNYTVHERARRAGDRLRQAHARGLDQRRVKPQDAVAYAAKILKEQLSIFINFEETEETQLPAGRRRGRAAQREPVPLGRRARALGSLGELPAEREHHAHRRARAAHRAGHAQDEELRPQVAEGDQGDPREHGPVARHEDRQLAADARALEGAAGRRTKRRRGIEERHASQERRVGSSTATPAAAARCSAT